MGRDTSAREIQCCLLVQPPCLVCPNVFLPFKEVPVKEARLKYRVS